MQKIGEKVDQIVLKSGDFIAIVQQKLIDSTLSVEQMETTANIAPVTSAMHRKLTVNNDNNLLLQSSPGSCSSDDNKLPFHYLFLDSSILKIFCQLLVLAQYVAALRNLELCNNISKKKGLAKCLEIV